MKKIIFSFVILLAHIQAFSQVSLGTTGSVSSPVKKYGDSIPSPYSGYKLGIEFLAGSDRWKFRTGLEYSSFTFASYTDRQASPYAKYKAEYLAIPIGLRYIFKGKYLNPFIDGSINFMGNIGHKNTGEISTEYNPTPNSFILSPALGAGILCNTNNNMYLSFMLSYAIQTSYMYKVPHQKKEVVDVRYNGINAVLSVGYNF